MKIKQLTLYTDRLVEQKHFYQQVLGFTFQNESEESFTVQVGWSTFTFQKSDVAHLYHYCFLIPSNKLQEAMDWIGSRVEILDTAESGKIVFFDTWNAHSFYFYDGAGNIAECIVRHDLDNDSDTSFCLADLLCISEIGLPTLNISRTQAQLNQLFDIHLWRRDLERFAAFGSQNGLLLLPNYRVRETWFPTDIPIKTAPFSIQIENHGRRHSFDYLDGMITNVITLKS